MSTAVGARLDTIRSQQMFVFFSNRIGCLISLLVSAAGTLVLLGLTGWIRL
jgi:hypothetical protein